MRTDVKVMVVDDEEPVRRTLTRFLRSLGIQNIIEGSNGQEAITMAESNPDIQLVLLDLKMPIVDGIQALTEIRPTLPKAKIVVLTGYPFYGDADLLVQQGKVVDFLVKPVDLDYLENILRTLIPLD